MPRALFALVLVAGLALPAAGRAQPYLGAVVAYHEEFDLGVGGFVEIASASWHPSLSVLVEGILFLPEDGRGVDLGYSEFNGNLLYRFEVGTGALSPFALAGFNLARLSFHQSIDVPTDLDFNTSDIEVGVNLGAGVTFTRFPLHPSVGGRFELEGGEGLVLFGNLGLPVGGGGQ